MLFCLWKFYFLPDKTVRCIKLSQLGELRSICKCSSYNWCSAPYRLCWSLHAGYFKSSLCSHLSDAQASLGSLRLYLNYINTTTPVCSIKRSQGGNGKSIFFKQTNKHTSGQIHPANPCTHTIDATLGNQNNEIEESLVRLKARHEIQKPKSRWAKSFSDLLQCFTFAVG